MFAAGRYDPRAEDAAAATSKEKKEEEEKKRADVELARRPR